MMQGFTAETVRRCFRNAPERGRLDGAIKDAAICLAQCTSEAQKADWWAIAGQQLKQAEECLARGDLQQGWGSLQSVNRSILLNSKDPERLLLAAIELRREAERKLSGWRAKAIIDLICDQKGEVRTDIALEHPTRIINALTIRDDQFQTDYFKILLRRRQLFWLFVLLVAAIATSLLLSALNLLPDPFNKIQLMTGVVLFGVLGAALSVARGLLASDLSAKIPAQQIGAFVIWMRPAIGAAAALISFALLNAKVIQILDWDPTSPTVIFTIAILSGFSERFIVGAIEKIGDDSAGGDKKK